jgi:hypothetical protein
LKQPLNGKKRKRGTPNSDIKQVATLSLYAKRILAKEMFDNERTNTFKALLAAKTDRLLNDSRPLLKREK